MHQTWYLIVTLMQVTSPLLTHEAERGGHFFLGSIPRDGSSIFLNGAILTQCTILKCVAASAAEAELGDLFLNAMEAKI